jgi:hypothetical protein
MPRTFLFLFLVVGANMLSAQQPDSVKQNPAATKLTAGTLPGDPAKEAAAIRDSYYHPDGMSGLDCDISIDWPAFFSSMKAEIAADRLKTIQGLKVRAHAKRGKLTDLEFDWAAGPLDTKDQIENGLKQMVGGFYQMYWPMVASSPIASAADVSKVEPLPDGGAKVYTSSANTSVIMTVDKENTPTHYQMESPALNATFDAQYIPAAKPVPGDLRRISSLDVKELIGTSSINLGLALDYQAVEEFYVPRHISFNVSGAYSLTMELSGCTVTRTPTAPKTQ